MKTTKNERQNARGAELAYVKGEAAAAPKAPVEFRPDAQDLDYVRECTERNCHEDARLFIAGWMADRWDDIYEGNGSATNGNPFRILLKAFEKIQNEHMRLGHLPLALFKLRLALTNAIEIVVSGTPLFTAWTDFLKVL
jgi:hypothetical protein